VVGLYDRFAPNIISATSVVYGKPEPDVFLFAAGWMRVMPRNCLVIEDSTAGVRAGRRAGMRVFGFAGGTHCGAGYRERLMEAGAELVFERMTELPSLVESAREPVTA
jgi:beta-phosphoglucomutase-like phosphatase (HAD superfamily)